jgi:hypothetical protein
LFPFPNFIEHEIANFQKFYKKSASALFSGVWTGALHPLPLFCPVDKFSTFFSLFTQDIDRFCTKQLLVDNYCAHIVTVVDKLRKGIAHQAII